MQPASPGHRRRTPESPGFNHFLTAFLVVPRSGRREKVFSFFLKKMLLFVKCVRMSSWNMRQKGRLKKCILFPSSPDTFFVKKKPAKNMRNFLSLFNIMRRPGRRWREKSRKPQQALILPRWYPFWRLIAHNRSSPRRRSKPAPLRSKTSSTAVNSSDPSSIQGLLISGICPSRVNSNYVFNKVWKMVLPHQIF